MGWLDKYQDGGKTDLWNTDRTAWVDSVNTANLDKNFVQRFFDSHTPSIPTPHDPTTTDPWNPRMTSTHLMSDNGEGYVFPRVVMDNNKLRWIPTEDEAVDYARQHNEGIQFKTPEQGSWYSNGYEDEKGVRHGYKQGSNVLKKYSKPKHENGGFLGTTNKGRNYSPAWGGQFQNGLDFKPKMISKNGSVVKDNLGYWNPDNWGKPVEIDSPSITMQGVDRELIGVSDEGDTKLLQPNKNYKFKGKKVTEYPIAKYGIGEVNELTNFTNTKSGKWLNKYS